MAVDFEAEGLLDGTEGEARKARLELLQNLDEDGFGLDELRQATHEGRLALLPLERALAGDGRRYTLAELAEESGLDADFFLEARRALGTATPDPVEPVFDERDVEAAKRIRFAREAGIPDEDQLELTRALSRSASSLATTATRVFGRSFLRAGDTERDLGLRYAEAAEQLRPLLSQALDHVLGIHLREELSHAALESVDIESGSLSAAEEVTVCFADIVGFTRLGEKLRADELGAVADRFDQLAVEVAGGPVRLVKMIGDAAMFVSQEPAPLLGIALDLVAAAEEEERDLPPLHVGIASGQALGRRGDWYGRPVNLASRLTDFARPGSVVAAQDIRDAVGEDAYAWSFAGKRKFKNVRGEVVVYRVRRAEEPARAPRPA